MACCEPELDKQAPVAYRNALIAVLAINLVMFGVEAAVGLFSGSRAPVSYTHLTLPTTPYV